MVLRESILGFRLNQQAEIKSPSYSSSYFLATDALLHFPETHFFFFGLRIIDFTFRLVER